MLIANSSTNWVCANKRGEKSLSFVQNCGCADRLPLRKCHVCSFTKEAKVVSAKEASLEVCYGLGETPSIPMHSQHSNKIWGGWGCDLSRYPQHQRLSKLQQPSFTEWDKAKTKGPRGTGGPTLHLCIVIKMIWRCWSQVCISMYDLSTLDITRHW